MESLFDGVKEFNAKDFQDHKDLFRQISRKQAPHSLFIGCSDSRIVPNLITKTLPGELFVIRNIANLVPFHRESEEFLSTTSAIEYAVKFLDVSNIIVCGHSNCGGCAALFMEDRRTAEIPHTMRWLELARKVKERMDSDPSIGPEEREWRTEQLNIVEQMNHLITYPYIKERFRKGTIAILGWYYIIETGEIFNYNKDLKTFQKIE